MGENSDFDHSATWESVSLKLLHGNGARRAVAGAGGPFDRLLGASNLNGVVGDFGALGGCGHPLYVNVASIGAAKTRSGCDNAASASDVKD